MVWFGVEPSYSEDAAGSLETGGNRPLDIKYQLIKLYADRYVSLSTCLSFSIYPYLFIFLSKH